MPAVLLFAVLLIALPAQETSAENNVSYIDADGSLKKVSSVTVLKGTEVSLNGGWYIVNNTLNYSDTLTINGDVQIILKDRQSMNAKEIYVNHSNKLTICAQSTGPQKGVLTVKGDIVDFNAGIHCAASAIIIINGGLVDSAGGWNSAGIGGREKENCGTVVINGGDINASGMSGAGIGSSSERSGGTIIINGGNINASSKDFSAGIGGSSEHSGGTIIINGGTVSAAGGFAAAGIGGGDYGNGGFITINGGTVTATGGWCGAGIGGGFKGNIDTIAINGGTVTATGGKSGAGIGSGWHGNIDTITINSGTVTAWGSSSAAGIGGGEGSSGGKIKISGDANVTAIGGDYYYEFGIGTGGGAGIGSGGTTYSKASAGTITIDTIGTVISSGGAGDGKFGKGADIGTGGWQGKNGVEVASDGSTDDESSRSSSLLLLVFVGVVVFVILGAGIAVVALTRKGKNKNI